MTVQNSSVVDDLNQLLARQHALVDDISEMIGRADEKLLPGLEDLLEREREAVTAIEALAKEIPPEIEDFGDG